MEIPTNWTFRTAEVADGFDRHVREQLPWYELMSGAVAHVARHYMTEGATVIDIGCATGNIGRLLEKTIADRQCRFVGIDQSEEMQKRYVGPGEFLLSNIEDADIPQFDVAIAFLCLMFLSVSARASVIERLRLRANPGAVIIIVDKFEMIGGYIGTAMARLTLAGKIASAVPADEILAKELSLIGVQRPMRASEIGSAVEIFRFGEFAGFAIET